MALGRDGGGHGKGIPEPEHEGNNPHSALGHLLLPEWNGCLQSEAACALEIAEGYTDTHQSPGEGRNARQGRGGFGLESGEIGQAER